MEGPRAGRKLTLVLGVCLGGLALLLAFPSRPALAFSLGYHFDLTREALSRRGFDSGAIGQAQLANYFDDGFEAAKTVMAKTPGFLSRKWGDLYGPASLRDASDTYMHFDDLGDTAGVTAAWERLVRNTYRAARRAEAGGDAAGLRTVLGASLHTVQDFYSHSNWSALDWGGDATWFNVPAAERDARDIYTSGRLSHDQINKDEATRPGFETAYREAFYASSEWIWLVKSWVSPGFWEATSRQTDTKIERETRYVRYLTWYKGLWKGPGTDADGMLAILGTVYMSETDKTYINRWKEYCPLLTGAPDSVAVSLAGYERVAGEVWLSVKTAEVSETGGGLLGDIDYLGQPDFYAIVSVNGTSYIEPMFEDKKQIKPTNWLTLVPLGTDEGRISAPHELAPRWPGLPEPAWARALIIEYALWDEDVVGGGVIPGLRGADDLCDIVPGLGQRTWTSSDPPETYRGAGRLIETDGYRSSPSLCGLFKRQGDGEEAKVRFTVKAEVPSRRVSSENLTDLTGGSPQGAPPSKPSPAPTPTPEPTPTPTPTGAPTPTPTPTPPAPTPTPPSPPPEAVATTGDLRLVAVDRLLP